MNDHLWSRAREAIESRLDRQQYQKWIAGLQVADLGEDRLELTAPNVFVRDWVRDNYLEILQEEVFRQANRAIRISINAGEGNSAPVAGEGNAPPVSSQDYRGTMNSTHTTSSGPRQDNSQEKLQEKLFDTSLGNRAGLRANYTFREFVVGSSNQFAHAASVAVSDMPGGKYNPLFIFGGVGLGKTHLLHAIGHRIMERNPQYRVIYLSSEAFVNELINAIRFEKMPQFREKFRSSCDMLLVDDIQFLAGKERTQEEFFHTFNTLYESGKQIVISSDTFPKDLKSLEERLRSRFEWGLIADIQAPEMETRVAIVKQKAEAIGILLPDDVAHYLATLMKSNVRELEGSLIRLSAFSSLSGKPLSVELAREVLRNLQSDSNRFISIDQVQEVVSNYFSISSTEIKSSKKNKNLAYPRQIAMYLCRKVLSCSFPDIGSKFGGKDHSTVIHAVRKIERLMKTDDKLRADLTILEKMLVQ